MTKQQYRWITTTVRSAAVRAVQELRHQPHTSLSGACRQVANQLDVHPNTVKNWWHAAVLADPPSTTPACSAPPSVISTPP